MKPYVGLTYDPVRIKTEHKNPFDWKVYGPFATEKTARDWEKKMLDFGCVRNTAGAPGWHFGYTCSITIYTNK